jgi:aldehyde:ferredoxin oxidoreductase
MGDLLRIDLTSRTITEESIPEDLTRELIGAKGVGTYYLSQEVPPAADPLGPENKLIFCVGPMGGTSMFGSNRYALYFVSPLTGGYCECYSGGNVTPQFARTGYKMVIVEGQASEPVYIEVSEKGGAIKSAAGVWGLDTYAAEEKLVEMTGVDGAQACVIGPAGERLVRFACVENNKWHSLGRGGPGAVMGSKQLKGLVFHGSKKVEVARPDAFKGLVKDLAQRGKDDAGVAAYRRGGTVNMVRLLNNANAFPTRYWTKGRLDDFEPLSAEYMVENYRPESGTCPPCLMRCLKKNCVPEGHPRAGTVVEGPEYETIYVFGGLCEIVDFGEIIYLNDICDRMGVDSMSAGNLCALAIEASRRGILDLKLDYGDAQGVAEFLQMMIDREGIGDVFAEGIKHVESELGLQDLAVHVKGMEPAGYDPRSLKGMGLTFMTAARGACHLRSTFYKPELAGLIPADAIDGKAEMLVDWENRLTIMDTLVYCRFYRDLVQWPYLTAVVNAAIGTDYSEEELAGIAQRIITMTHDFNATRGITQEWLPKHIMEHPQQDPDRRAADPAEFKRMLDEYYASRGWGKPSPEDAGVPATV